MAEEKKVKYLLAVFIFQPTPLNGFSVALGRSDTAFPGISDLNWYSEAPYVLALASTVLGDCVAAHEQVLRTVARIYLELLIYQ